MNPKLPKLLRHTLGVKTFESTVRSLRLIVVANRAEDKRRPLQDLILEIEGLWVFVRLLYDFRGISSGEFKTLSEKLGKMQPQAEGWLRWDRERRQAPAPSIPSC